MPLDALSLAQFEAAGAEMVSVFGLTAVVELRIATGTSNGDPFGADIVWTTGTATQYDAVLAMWGNRMGFAEGVQDGGEDNSFLLSASAIGADLDLLGDRFELINRSASGGTTRYRPEMLVQGKYAETTSVVKDYLAQTLEVHFRILQATRMP